MGNDPNRERERLKTIEQYGIGTSDVRWLIKIVREKAERLARVEEILLKSQQACGQQLDELREAHAKDRDRLLARAEAAEAALVAAPGDAKDG